MHVLKDTRFPQGGIIMHVDGRENLVSMPEISKPPEANRITSLASRRARKQMQSPSQRIAQLEEHVEQLTFALFIIRDEVEALAKRPLLRRGAFKGAND